MRAFFWGCNFCLWKSFTLWLWVCCSLSFLSSFAPYVLSKRQRSMPLFILKLRLQLTHNPLYNLLHGSICWSSLHLSETDPGWKPIYESNPLRLRLEMEEDKWLPLFSATLCKGCGSELKNSTSLNRHSVQVQNGAGLSREGVRADCRLTESWQMQNPKTEDRWGYQGRDEKSGQGQRVGQVQNRVLESSTWHDENLAESEHGGAG